MSELISQRGRRNLRRQLLASVSLLVLASTLYPCGADAEEGEGQPQVWIEVGSQLERADRQNELLTPPIFQTAAPGILAPWIGAQKIPTYAIGEQGKITFEPKGSKWVLSASLRYGRANAGEHLHYQTNHPSHQTVGGKLTTEVGRPVVRYSDGRGKSDESHFILDFQAGKDLGLGMFGAKSTSIVSVGIRVAQFESSSQATMRVLPHYRTGTHRQKYGVYDLYPVFFQNNVAAINISRSSRAIGPSLSWDASAPIIGNDGSATIAFDWGTNAAVLFGRQRARVHHSTTNTQLYEHPGTGEEHYVLPGGYFHGPYDRTRARTVAIPNVGGFAGFSFRYSNAKVSMGYRGDFFFNAMDVGIDTHKSSMLGLYGPFATISVGIGG